MTFRHSFVVPSYNHAAFIGETIESLLHQQTPGSEVVVSDDGSTDGSRDVIARYRDRVRIVYPPRRMGMMGNYNFAVGQAQSDWVSLMGSDDKALPGFVTAVRAGVEAHPEAVLVSGNFQHIDGTGKLLKSEKVLSVKPFAPPPENFHTQLVAVKVHPAAHAFRKSMWEKVGGFDETMHLFGDWALWLKLSACGAFVHRPEFLAQYRIEYRPGLARRRLPEVLHDVARLALVVIPEVARQVPGADPAMVAQGSRALFRQRLVECGRDLPPGERDFAVDLLREWADACGQRPLLDQFAAGATISGGLRDSWLWRTARSVYKAVR
ncbi:MAG TPA: glycosyltransferase [Vineibacter sp.]|nr:glycosyltransferase [Vineibacter sp.]